MSYYSVQISLDNDYAFANRLSDLRRDYHLVLAEVGFGISAPELKTDYIEIRGMDGALDASNAPQGYPTYKDRTITCKLFREQRPFTPADIAEMRTLVSTLQGLYQGRRVRLILPDDTTHYFVGRVSFDLEPDEGFITLAAAVFPYRLKNTWTSFSTDALTTSWQTFYLTNEQRYVIPEIRVFQTTELQVLAGVRSIPPAVILTSGTVWKLPDTLLVAGAIPVQMRIASGSGGEIDITYREGKL